VALKDNYYSSKNDTPYYGVERELKEGVYIIKIENPSNPPNPNQIFHHCSK